MDSLALSATAKTQLTGVIKKITNLGIEGAGKYQSLKYQGLLQEDILAALKDSTNCKLQIFKDLKDKLLDISRPEEPSFNGNIKHGLLGEYWNLPPFESYPVDFTDRLPTFSRIDKTLDFTWKLGSPAPKITVDYFGIRWTGQIWAPITGTYIFKVRHDDGVRLFVDSKRVIDKWKVFDGTTRGEIWLEGDKWHSIKIEMFERRIGATFRLNWIRPGAPLEEVVPTEYMRPNPIKLSE